MKVHSAAALAAAFYLAHIFCEAWTSSSQIFLGFSIIAAVVAWWRSDLKLVSDPLYLALSLFVFGSILSALFGPQPASSAIEVSEAFTFLTVPLAFALYRRDRAFHGRVLIAFALLASLISIWGMFEWVVLGWRDLEHRISGPAAHVMTLSGILVIVSLLMLRAGIVRRSPLYIFVFGLTIVTMLMTQTRGAWIGWLAGVAVLVLIRKPRMVGWVVAALLLALILSPTALFYRVTSVVSMRPASNYDRVKMIEGGVAMIRDHPVFGTGPGSTKDNYVLYRSYDALRFRTPHLHNNVVQIWAERGILPLFAYLLLIVMLLHRFYLLRGGTNGWFAEAGLAVVVATAVGGLFEYNFGDSEVLVTMLDASIWCLAGAEAGGTIGAETVA